jgi:hypothetical protein
MPSPSQWTPPVESRPSRLTFGSFLVYPPRARTGKGLAIKKAVLGVKEDRYFRKAKMRMPEHAAMRLRESLPDSPLEDFFAGDPLLVPIPRSGLLRKNALWPAQRICEALIQEGLGSQHQALLTRQTAVSKSAGSPDRPSPEEHYASLAAGLPPQAERVILVDDVITRGASAMGAYWRLLDILPSAEIHLFAIARTVQDEAPEEAIDCVLGSVVYQGNNWLERNP